MSATVSIFIDGVRCQTPVDISVAAALISQADIHVFRRSAKRQALRPRAKWWRASCGR